MEQTNNVVGNFRVSIGGVIITFNVMDNPETIAQDLAKANAICDNVLAHLMPPTAEQKIQKSAGDAQKAAEAITAAAALAKEKKTKPAAEVQIDPPMIAPPEPVAEEVATTDVPPTVDAEPVYTLADIRKLLGEIIDLGHRPAAEQYVQYHCKTKRTSEIPVEKYPAIMKDLANLAAGLKAGAYNGYDDFAKAFGYELSTDGQE